LKEEKKKKIFYSFFLGNKKEFVSLHPAKIRLEGFDKQNKFRKLSAANEVH